MKNQKIKTSFLNPEGTQAWANKTGNNFMPFISIFVENYLLYNAIDDFSLWLKTGSNPVGINRFQSFSGNIM